MLTKLAQLTDHPAFRVPPAPTPAEIPDVAERRAALWKRRQDIEAMVFYREGTEDNHFHWSVTALTQLLKLGLMSVGLWQRGRRNARTVHLREVVWEHPGLPKSLDGLTILHLADLHYRRADGEFAAAVENLLEGVDADLCLMTGDYRFGHLGPCDHVWRNLRRLLERVTIRHGCFAILGNHDATSLAEPFPELGIRLLYNEGLELNIRDTPVWIGGTDDSHIIQSADLLAALHGKREEHFTILLTHTPEDIHEAEQLGADVYLCGHTHGGQIRLPWWGPVVSNAKCAPEHKHGIWRVGDLFGITSAGLGTTDIPVRYNCPAEAHRITLRSV